MEQRDLIVIGAGVAGLATACYARMNGYDVQVLEMHDKPGGMCTSWTRKGYVFDYCIHNLVGTQADTGTAMVWDELGALEGVPIVRHDRFVRIEDEAGRAVDWYTDLARLRAHLEELSPGDRKVIADLIWAAEKFVDSDIMGVSLGGFWRTLKAAFKVSAINRWQQIKLAEFGQRFADPFLQRAFNHVQYDLPGDKVPMIALLLFMAGLSSGDLGWPHGGSLAFAERIARRLADLGGEVTTKARVERILVEGDRAVGVRLADGSEHRARRVISAADGHATLFDLLGGAYLTDTIKTYYANYDTGADDPQPFGLCIFCGLDRELPDAPHALTLLLDEPVDVGDLAQDSIHVVTFGPDSGLCEPGTSILKVEVQARYGRWKQLRDTDRAAYKQEKQRVADGVLDRIAPRYPGLSEAVVTRDVSTPPTAERYTGNLFGCQPGPPEQDAAVITRRGLSRTLPGLAGFHMVSQWASAQIGVSTVAVQGRNLIRELCKEDGKRFVTAG